MKTTLGQSLIGIIIVLVVVGLISGGLYYYLSRQIPEIPEITEKPTEEGVVKPEEAPPEEIKPEITCQNECSPAGSKKCSDSGYQTCGNYDVDNCLEWSSITNCPSNTICQNGECVYIQQKCSDGTPYGRCSINKPFYCDNGKIISNCTICGCPTGEQCQSGGCVTVTIECETNQDCDDGNEKTIDRCEKFSEFLIRCTHRLGLIGNIKIAIVEFEAEGTDYADNFLESVNNKAVRKIPLGPYKDPFSGKEMTESFFSFYYLEDFFEQEAKKYGKNVSISVDVFGPFSLSETPPPRKGIDPCEPTLGNFFEAKSEKYNLNLSSYDVINYVYFSNQDNAFYGCAGRDKNTYIAVGRVEIENLGFFSSVIRNLAHETAHKFGASDKYAGYGCVHPSGYVEPNKDPLHPQFEACLMCGLIPITEKMTRQPADISEVVICEKTAEEIGWK
jgi:hypothetical protein